MAKSNLPKRGGNRRLTGGKKKDGKNKKIKQGRKN